MYSVSQAYINKLLSVSSKQRSIRGYVDNIPFTEDDVLQGSFKFSDMAVKSSDIKLGGVFIGSLNITFLESFSSRITRGTWRGREINAEIGLLLGYDENEQEIWEYVPIKPYVIDEANHSALGVDVTAYDYMSKFDASIQMNVSSGLLYGFATLVCNECGVELGMTAEEMSELPNGDQILGLYPNNDIETWRDLISWMAVTIGGFATIDRSGKLVFRNWGTDPVIVIDQNNRFMGGTWSDFSTNYTAISVTNIEDGTSSYYADELDDGLTLEIGANPLLQYGTKEVVANQRRAVLGAIKNLKYIPFKSSSLIDPSLDLGDVVAYSGGLASTRSLCCVMRIDFSFSKGATLQGFGKNPSLNNARGKLDKELAAQAKNQKNQGIIYYPYINAEEIEINTTEKRIYRIAFATAEPTTVEMKHELKLLSEFDSDLQNIQLFYYFDGDKLSYKPEETYDEEGYHIVKGDYWIQGAEVGITHYWEVKAKTSSGTATISIGDLRALLKGQGMVASVSFDGTLELSDEYEPFAIGMGVIGMNDNAVIGMQTAGESFVLQDVGSVWNIGQNIVPLAENMSLTGRAIQYNRITTDGDSRTTTDGDPRITSY